MEETALGLLVPVTGDPPAGPAQIGETSKRTDALLQKGGVAGHVFVEEATRASTALGAFSTPLAVELKQVRAGQMIDVYLSFYALGASPQPSFALQIGGSTVVGEASASAAAGKYGLFTLSPTVFGERSSLNQVENELAESLVNTQISFYKANYANLSGIWRPFRVPADATNVKVELVGKVASGTAKIKSGLLSAHVRG